MTESGVTLFSTRSDLSGTQPSAHEHYLFPFHRWRKQRMGREDQLQYRPVMESGPRGSGLGWPETMPFHSPRTLAEASARQLGLRIWTPVRSRSSEAPGCQSGIRVSVPQCHPRDTLPQAAWQPASWARLCLHAQFLQEVPSAASGFLTVSHLREASSLSFALHHAAHH